MRPWFDPWVGKISWRRKWQPTPVLLPGKVHGLRSLVGYSPWDRKESDTTERLHFTSLQGSIYSQTMLIKTPLLHQSLGPCVLLPLSLSLSISLFLADSLEHESQLCNPGNISLFPFSNSLIIDSGPPGSSSIKDQQLPPRTGTLVHMADSDGVTPEGLLRLVSTKTWVNRLESPLTFLLYFIAYLKFRDFQFHAS